MIAVGSPYDARNFRIALLANSCADTSRCAARPVCTAPTRCSGGRGSASSDTPGARSAFASDCENAMPHRPMLVSRSGSTRGGVSTAPTTNRRWTRSTALATSIGAGGRSSAPDTNSPAPSVMRALASSAGNAAMSSAAAATSDVDSANVSQPPKARASRNVPASAVVSITPVSVTGCAPLSSAATRMTGIANSVVRNARVRRRIAAYDVRQQPPQMPCDRARRERSPTRRRGGCRATRASASASQRRASPSNASASRPVVASIAACDGCVKRSRTRVAGRCRGPCPRIGEIGDGHQDSSVTRGREARRFSHAGPATPRKDDKIAVLARLPRIRRCASRSSIFAR